MASQDHRESLGALGSLGPLDPPDPRDLQDWQQRKEPRDLQGSKVPWVPLGHQGPASLGHQALKGSRGSLGCLAPLGCRERRAPGVRRGTPGNVAAPPAHARTPTTLGCQELQDSGPGHPGSPSRVPRVPPVLLVPLVLLVPRVARGSQDTMDCQGCLGRQETWGHWLSWLRGTLRC